MGGGYEIDMVAGAEADVMVITWRGEVTLALWREFLEALVVDPRSRPGLGRLHDFRAVTIDFEIEQVRQMAVAVNARDRSLGRRRVAHLVKNDMSFGVLRMFASIAESGNSDMQVFRDVAPALAWAGAADDSRLPAEGIGEAR